jgi:Protein of unknown function (DUF1488)
MIEFPNHSRSYDRTRHAVRFWGYYSAMQASFFINEDALRRIQPDTRLDESGFLNGFDSNRHFRCRGDCVAKVPKRRAAKFSLNDKTSGNRRSM